MNDPVTTILLAAALYVLGSADSLRVTFDSLGSAFTARFVSFNEDSAPENGDMTEKEPQP